jgi:hypothetical protein
VEKDTGIIDFEVLLELDDQTTKALHLQAGRRAIVTIADQDDPDRLPIEGIDVRRNLTRTDGDVSARSLVPPTKSRDPAAVSELTAAVPDDEVVARTSKTFGSVAVVDVDMVVKVKAGIMDHDVDPVPAFTFDVQVADGPVRRVGIDHHRRREASRGPGEDEDAAEHRHAGRKGEPDDLGAGESAVVFDLLRHV